MDPSFEPLDVHESRRGNSIGVTISLVTHFGILALLWVKYAEPIPVAEPPVRYVQLMSALPRTFTEAPGPRREKASPEALYSDANRRASSPRPGAGEPTRTPGMVPGSYVPGNAGPMQKPSTTAEANPAGTAPEAAESRFEYRVGGEPSIDWRNAISEIGKVASLGGDLGVSGGDDGFAESGPISFETQWYEWGDYAALMVAKIRHHWYGNMPPIVRMGLKGVVTIRFTIDRSGAITDVQILSTSGTPPYDFAARKAIELASPLPPLPADFPNPSERVTAQFYYNQHPPRR